MQPIVLRIANSEGFADYTNGLTPDIDLRESGYLWDLGDPMTFVTAALSHEWWIGENSSALFSIYSIKDKKKANKECLLTFQKVQV